MTHANTQEDPHSAFQKAFKGIARHKHHYLGRWSYKLAERDEKPNPERPIKREETERPETAREDTSTGPVQFDFGF